MADQLAKTASLTVRQFADIAQQVADDQDRSIISVIAIALIGELKHQGCEAAFLKYGGVYDGQNDIGNWIVEVKHLPLEN